MDVRKQGFLCKAGIEKAAQELGFPLTGNELHQAMAEMDFSGKGEVSFPEFLAWWNNSQGSQAVQKKIFIGVRTGSRWATVTE